MRQEDSLKEIEYLRGQAAQLPAVEARLALAERALCESREQLRRFYEDTPLAYQSLDEEGRIVDVNQSWLETFGYAREEVLGAWFGDFLTRVHAEQFSKIFPESKDAGEIHWSGFDMVRKDGSTVSMTLDGRIGLDRSCGSSHTHCIIHDLMDLRRSRQELQERQERLSSALDGASLGIWEWDLTTGKAYWTARTLGMLGYKANEFDLNLETWKRLVHPDDWPGVTANLTLHIEGKHPVFMAEYRIMNKNGQWQWVRARGRVIESAPDGKPLRMAGVVVDVTDRKAKEERLRLVNRALKTLSECNQALVRAQDEASLVKDLCQILVEHGGYRMAWIAFAEQDEARSVRPVSQAGFDEGYLDTLNITWADSELGRGPTGTAIRTGKPVIARNIFIDPSFDPWREDAVERGYVSSAAIPMARDGCVIGAINVYAVEPDAFSDEELKLLSELADDLTYGITALRTRVEREQAECARRAAEQQLINIIEFLPDATFVIDGDKRIIAWNRACESMTGVNKQDLLGRGDYAYAEPFFGERRPILIDLLDLPVEEIERSYKYVIRKDQMIYAESFIARLRNGKGAHLWGVAAPLLDQQGNRCGAIEVVRDVTEQKHIEHALRESELKHRTLFETASDAILLMRHNRFVDCNSRTLTMFSCARDEIIGARPHQLSPPTQPDGVPSDEKALEKINLALSEGPQLFEWEYVRLDGARFAAEMSLNRIDLDGETMLQAIVRDITDRKKAEERLVESERKYRELVEHANSIILRWTREGRINFLNEFGQKFFGYAADEIIGRHVMGTIVPMTDSGGRDLGPLMDQILADPKTFEQNINENMRRDGERVIIAWTNKIVPDEQGNISEILSIGMDITELKTAQEEIKERNTELRTINRIVTAATGSLDLEAVLEEVLDEALELVGLEGGTICLVAPDGTLELHANRAATEATIQDLKTSSVKVGECLCGGCADTLAPLILRDRSEVFNYATREASREDPIHFHAAFPLVTASKCVGVLCIFTRTDRKPQEQRLKLLETITGQLALAIENAQLYEASQRHAEELELIVAERTRELAYAKERAEAADHLKSAFMATMSHELRTPLNSIIGFTGIILRGLAGPLNAEQRKQLEMVRSSSRHLLALINDVLDISKIEAGQLQVANEPFNLRESIDKVLGIVTPMAEKKGLALHANIVAVLGDAVGDQRRVEQILLNLLNNAIKFTDTGEVSLFVEFVSDFVVRGRAFAQPAVRMSVSDTGIGIKAEDLTTLFQPFRQIESGLSRNYDGTGLGLAICRRLADLMGGDIGAESTWSKGSTFRFTFPLKGPGQS